MEEIIAILLGWGILGLAVAAFTESFCSPILPDFILIPLAIANHEMAIYYGIVATIASVLGGIIGYWIGNRIGVAAAQKMLPAKYAKSIRKTVNENAAWTVFIAALSPIPYKFVSITAGAFGIRWSLFMVISFLGRAKRFLLEGILIYYFGPQAVTIIGQYSDNFVVGSVIVVAIGLIIWYIYKKKSKKGIAVLE